MNVTVLLSWYDEPEELLYAAVTSASVIADKVVAADGAYAQTPGALDASPRTQYRAIQEAASDANLDLQVLPGRIWDGQVAKRNRMLQGQAADWLMWLDADWVLHGDREEIRRVLAVTEAEVLRVRFHQPASGSRDYPHAWHRDYDGDTRWEPMVLRNLGGMRCENEHWRYSGERADGVRVSFTGPEYPVAVSGDLGGLLVEHRCMFRDEVRLARNREFLRVREVEYAVTGRER